MVHILLFRQFPVSQNISATILKWGGDFYHHRNDIMEKVVIILRNTAFGNQIRSRIDARANLASGVRINWKTEINFFSIPICEWRHHGTVISIFIRSWNCRNYAGCQPSYEGISRLTYKIRGHGTLRCADKWRDRMMSLTNFLFPNVYKC